MVLKPLRQVCPEGVKRHNGVINRSRGVTSFESSEVEGLDKVALSLKCLHFLTKVEFDRLFLQCITGNLDQLVADDTFMDEQPNDT